MWQLSIRSKIILTLLLTGLACLAAGAIIGYRAGETALTRSVEEQLTAQREIKRRRIESYVDNELRFTVAIGGLPETTEATKALIAAYREMRAETQANPAASTSRHRRPRGMVQQGFAAAAGQGRWQPHAAGRPDARRSRRPAPPG